MARGRRHWRRGLRHQRQCAGGGNSVRHGVRIGSPNSASLFPYAYMHVTLSDNVMRGAFRAGLFIDLTRVDVTLKNNTID